MILHKLGPDLPGFASFLETILAFEGTMNFPRKSLRGSSASREAAYSFVDAWAGKAGLASPMVEGAPLTPLVVGMMLDRDESSERRLREGTCYFSFKWCRAK